MFGTLLESRPVRRRTPAGFAASLVLHSVVLIGAVAASTGRQTPIAPKPEVIATVFQVEPPKPTPVTPAPQPVATPTPPTPAVVSVPITVPVGLPPIDLTPKPWNDDTPAIFQVGGTSRDGTPGIAPIDVAQPLRADEVEVAVTFDRGSPLPRFPQLLKDAGVEGSARFRFIVDTLGRVELGSVEAVASTHPLFAAAVQAALPRMRFVPARVGDRKVRQLVEFPMVFEIHK